jgi:hypothetical protein
LRASDLVDGDRIIGEISHVEMRVLGRDAGNTKPVLCFLNACSSLVLNATNWQILEAAYGEDSSSWAGQRVALTAKDAETFDGRPYRTIIVAPQDPIAMAGAGAKRADLDDEIPF